MSGSWGISVLQEAVLASVLPGSVGVVFLEGENKLEGLLKLSSGTCAASFPLHSVGQRSHRVSPDSREWRNGFHHWLGRAAKSPCKGACPMDGRNLWPLNS